MLDSLQWALGGIEISPVLAPESEIKRAIGAILGAMPHEVFLGLRFLQDGPPNASERIELATCMRSQAQGIPLYALLFGKLLGEAGRPKEAAELWREALEHDGDSDVRTRLLVALSVVEGDAGRRRQLLQEAAGLNGNLVAAAGAALSLRFNR